MACRRRPEEGLAQCFAKRETAKLISLKGVTADHKVPLMMADGG